MYEEGTNKPIYGDREDGNKIHYDYASISEYERKSYAWQGSYGIKGVEGYYNQVKSMGANRYLAGRDKALTSTQRRQEAKKLTVKNQLVIELLDEKGRWIENNMIYRKVFVRNVNLLCDYLELSKPKK